MKIPEELKVKINQIKDLDKRRNRSGVPQDVYRDISGIIADESTVVIEELTKIIENN
jgi:hypothetical protein